MKPFNYEKYWERGSMKALQELTIFGVQTVFDQNFDKRHFEMCHNKPFLYNFVKKYNIFAKKNNGPTFFDTLKKNQNIFLENWTLVDFF